MTTELSVLVRFGAECLGDVMGEDGGLMATAAQSKPSFSKAMRIFAVGANYPVLVHCIHGKDRTGLIVMLMLLLCDVPTKVPLSPSTSKIPISSKNTT